MRAPSLPTLLSFLGRGVGNLGSPANPIVNLCPVTALAGVGGLVVQAIGLGQGAGTLQLIASQALASVPIAHGHTQGKALGQATHPREH